MGVSGSGKTTIGKLLSQETGIPFYDGDDFHPPANIEKMEQGMPLNDMDREEWLKELNELARTQIQRKEGAIIGSSALKERYRKILGQETGGQIHWVYLKGSFDTISARINSRDKHFMPASLLQSQFDTLEPPDYGLHIDIEQSPEDIANQIIKKLNL